jgi:hypothetical protein
MSDDPETARQIAELSRDTRPLLVLDVDEVLLEFVRPFLRFLETHGLEHKLQSFRLHGNILDRTSGLAIEDERVTRLIDDFFAAQHDWQIVAEGAVEAVAGLAATAEIVMLTAMPHRHRATRRALLDQLGFPYPLLTTEAEKGPAIRQLRGDRPRPVAFVDDIPRNLISVQATVADAHLFNLTTFPGLRPLLPPLPEGIPILEDWRSAAPLIAAALGV